MLDVVILAAGRGSRLGMNLPKCLAEFRGRTMLQRQVELIRACPPFSPRRIHVVTGYKHDLVERHVRSARLDVHLIRNPFWNLSAILGSAWLSLPHVGDTVLRMDSDVLFSNPGEVARLVMSPRTCVCLGDSYSPRTTPVAKVRDGIVESISLEDSYCGSAEWLCVEMYRDGDYTKLVEASHDLVAGAHYFRALNRSLPNMRPPAFWMSGAYEMDTEEDMAHVDRLLG